MLSQGAGPAQEDELCVLRRSGGLALSAARCHVREVMLWGNGQPLVYARSVLPAVQSRLAWRALRGLGSRPLADQEAATPAPACR